jgi:hypothetical protein
MLLTNSFCQAIRGLELVAVSLRQFTFFLPIIVSLKSKERCKELFERSFSLNVKSVVVVCRFVRIPTICLMAVSLEPVSALW